MRRAKNIADLHEADDDVKIHIDMSSNFKQSLSEAFNLRRRAEISRNNKAIIIPAYSSDTNINYSSMATKLKPIQIRPFDTGFKRYEEGRRQGIIYECMCYAFLVLCFVGIFGVGIWYFVSS